MMTWTSPERGCRGGTARPGLAAVMECMREVDIAPR